MIEIIDNLSQVLVAMLGCIISGVFYYKSRKQPFFILTCFYGCFMLAGLYWMLYTILVTDAPPMFYVSEIGWLSSYLFCICSNTAFLIRKSVLFAAVECMLQQQSLFSSHCIISASEA